MPAPLLVLFEGGSAGSWRIDRSETVAGEGLPPAERLDMRDGGAASPERSIASWSLRGSTGNTRYTTRPEATTLAAVQEGLRRPAATRAALIPIRKSAAWWDLAQDERRAIFEEQSRHIGIGLAYLPGVARRLHHGRELGEPFDFLTWFEFAPEHAAAFEHMVASLRATPEWRYVDREIDFRLSRDADG